MLSVATQASGVRGTVVTCAEVAAGSNAATATAARSWRSRRMVGVMHFQTNRR
jgi:hypothetical protein